MADLDKLVSTVEGATAEALSQLETEAQAAAADSSVQQSEIEASIASFLASLATTGVIDENDPIAQLSAAEPAIAAFVAALQTAITDAKAGTTQGLLLAQQLQAGSITQAQFQTAIQGIVLTPSQLQNATAVQLPGATQALLLALASSTQLNQLQKLADNITPTAGGPTLAKMADNITPANPPVKPKLATNAVISSTVGGGKLGTDQTDQKLGNKVDWLTNIINIAAKVAAQNLAASASSLLSLNPQPRIMTGARAVIRLNNKLVALCNNVQYEVSTDWQEIRGIDELLPNDLAPTSFSVKGSMSIYRVPNKSPVGDFLQQDMFRGMIWPLSTIEIRDKRTDELIMLVKRAAITSRSEAFTKNQLTSTSLSFVGIGFRDEQMPEVLPDELTGSDDGTGGLLDTFKAITNKLF